jgi:hypothetical protein
VWDSQHIVEKTELQVKCWMNVEMDQSVEKRIILNCVTNRGHLNSRDYTKPHIGVHVIY